MSDHHYHVHRGHMIRHDGLPAGCQPNDGPFTWAGNRYATLAEARGAIDLSWEMGERAAASR